MKKEEINEVLAACDDLDIDPPWDHTVDLGMLPLRRAIVNLIESVTRRSDNDDEDRETNTSRDTPL